MSRLRPPLASLVAAGLLAAFGGGPALAQQPGPGAQKAVFATKAEAEAAAKHFHCTGAHKMGNQWMPCATHGETKGGPSGHGSH
ncbi:MAG: DUF3721 domain-containing protein [Aphanothece saxicola GSE-SYN-MK-01-06B]|nr:DUF3721 domain-containing protein [Aphanothece saxicola GSE-SYN-MK-01-06B]